MRKKRSFLIVFLALFFCVFLFFFGGQYKFITIKSSSGELVGLWSSSQLLLNKDLDVIAKKYNNNFKKEQKGFEVSFVDKTHTNAQLSNSGIYYKCVDGTRSNRINFFIEEKLKRNKNIASNLYYVLLKCSSPDIDLFDIKYNDFMNNLMRISSNNNIFKSSFIYLGG